MPYITLREDTANTRGWTTIETLFSDSNVRLSTETVFDNGVVRLDVAANTDINETPFRTVTRTDGEANAFAWNTIETTYDAGGILSSRVVIFDNGVERYDEFEDGVRTSSTRVDNPNADDFGVMSWESIQVNFDLEGNRISRSIQYDDRTSLQTTYENGVRVQQTQIDPAIDGTGARNWEFIDSYFDENGDLEERVILYDNGLSRETFYNQGSVTAVYETDNSADGSLYNWETREVFYFNQFEQNIRQTNTQFDNGVDREDVFVDGSRNYRIDRDLSPDGIAETWQQQERWYDQNGNLELQHDVIDNGDEFVFIYDNGDREQRIELDGDGSEDWLIRVTDFGADGNTVTTYDSFEDAPFEITNYFFDIYVEV